MGGYANASVVRREGMENFEPVRATPCRFWSARHKTALAWPLSLFFLLCMHAVEWSL